MSSSEHKQSKWDMESMPEDRPYIVIYDTSIIIVLEPNDMSMA